jgi:hypothetical protein
MDSCINGKEIGDGFASPPPSLATSAARRPDQPDRRLNRFALSASHRAKENAQPVDDCA